MATPSIPIHFPGCVFECCHERNQELLLVIRSSAPTAACPTCEQDSSHVHSYYERRPCDLPVSERCVRLLLKVRRFRCRNVDCKRCTFSERLPNFLPVHARRTRRLMNAQRAVAMVLGGQAGSRLLKCLHMPTSHDTLLRLIRSWQQPQYQTPRVLGVDDWSIRKHVSYGTILLDLERRRPIDLLQDRSAETLGKWLQEHPGIEIITRDRSSEYARGAREGAPGALQVADRWHLLHNLKQMLDRLLGSIHQRLRELPAPEGEGVSVITRRLNYSIRDTSPGERALSGASRQRRLERYQQVKQLYEAGWKIKQIERELGINHKTVRKYVYADSFPERGKRCAGRSILDPYLAYMEQRHGEGCENALQLWREIREQGYPGSTSQVQKWMKARRSKRGGSKKVLVIENEKDTDLSEVQKPVPPPPPPELPSAKKLAWLIMRDEDELEAEDRTLLLRIRQDSIVDQIDGLAKQFIKMVKDRLPGELDRWLKTSKASGIAILRNFAYGITRDYGAVRAALETPWSNGQTEGQVTRLKLIKRQMYGRAKFDLLKRRVLYNA